MSREKKKGTSGNAKAFITRARALKKLQLSLPEFRRLCILKGIYPRDPRKKLQGSDKTYYLSKDIDFLAHERLISTIRTQNVHKKKVVKARAKRRIDLLKRLALSTPKSRLDHLVVERYPHFTDAIRELDDPLCIVALFANLPADHKVGIAPARVANCQRLLKQFYHFVAHTAALRRVFVSIKGYYFQASLCGETVTWVTPHRFTQVLPADVDYTVMLTFLELYECIMAFVNFRLYTSRNLAYPPAIHRIADANALELTSLYVKELKAESLANDNTPAVVSDQAVQAAEKTALVAAEDESDDDQENNQQETEPASENVLSDNPEEDDMRRKPITAVFAGKSVILGREVPFVELEFALMATGADKVSRQDDLPEGASLDNYTHWVTDRPKVSVERNMSVEYVQPQYVFDSINAAVLLPTALYAPGANLPPHLSPFVSDEDDGGYRPWFKDVLDRIKAGDTSVVAEAAAVVYAEGEAKAKKARLSLENPDVVKEGEGKIKSKTKNVPDGSEKRRSKSKRELSGQDLIENNAVVRSSSPSVEESHDESGTEMLENEEDGDGIESESDEDDVNVSDEADGEVDNEVDDEGAEEELKEKKQKVADKEGKEMATLMLSRKKARQYNKQKREERKKDAVKQKLTEKRKKLEEERSEVLKSKPVKRRRR